MATPVDLAARRVRAESVDLAARRARAGVQRQPRSSGPAHRESEAGRAPLWRYLPLALLVTTSLVFAPALLAAAIVPRAGLLSALASVACAVVASLAIASGEAAVWKRCPGSRDLVFGDLLLWGWARRCWAERRLARARSLYDAASRAGPAVSIELLGTLSALLETRDAYTHGHSQRVARHAERIARAMRLDRVQTAKIRTAAAVHDVGKLYTPRAILNNPRRLSEAEFEVMKRHAADGADMLAAVGDPEIAAMVRHHHERVDGSGYPDRLAGSQIPLGSRIIAVADTFDSITSSRPYRTADKQKRALDVLEREAGHQLDGAAVSAFRDRYSPRRSVAGLAFAAAALQRLAASLRASSASLGSVAGGAVSLLPAFGAAGLLALSPALDRNAAPHHGVPAAAAPQAGQLAAPAPGPAIDLAPTAGARPEGERVGAGVGRGPGHRRRGSTAAPASGGSPAIRPAAPVRATSPGDQAHPPASSPTQGGPSRPTAPGQPPTGGASPIPGLPVSPPATPPSVPVPTVSTPSVPLPTVSTPSVSTPSVTAPGGPQPTFTIPGLTAPGANVAG